MIIKRCSKGQIYDADNKIQFRVLFGNGTLHMSEAWSDIDKQVALSVSHSNRKCKIGKKYKGEKTSENADLLIMFKGVPAIDNLINALNDLKLLHHEKFGNKKSEGELNEKEHIN